MGGGTGALVNRTNCDKFSREILLFDYRDSAKRHKIDTALLNKSVINYKKHDSSVTPVDPYSVSRLALALVSWP